MSPWKTTGFDSLAVHLALRLGRICMHVCRYGCPLVGCSAAMKVVIRVGQLLVDAAASPMLPEQSEVTTVVPSISMAITECTGNTFQMYLPI